MLTFYRGNDTEALANELVQLYDRQPLEDPLAQEIVVVQNHGMARWLSTQLARRQGVAANMKFEFPAERAWDLYRVMDPGIPQDLPSDREPMTWTIFQLLQELPGRSPFKAVWRYMRDREDQWSPLKAWKLANRIGDLFDQYLVYRPQMLLDWEQENRKGFGAAEAWQSALWRKLQKKWGESEFLNQNDVEETHRPAVHVKFLRKLKAGEVATGKLPDRITLFGLSGLPPDFIELFVNISPELDLHWFWMDPLSDQSMASLRESWGGEGRDFLTLFHNCVKSADIAYESQELDSQPDKERPKLSQTLDLFDTSTKQPVTFNLQLPEIHIHSCHSPLREVEVLHDQLLDLFEENPELEPDDILILSPDIQTYAPFIEAVFGTTETGLPGMPFHVVDDHTGPRKEVFNSFGKLLHLLDSRFKVSEVLDLLSTRVVRRRYDISEDELDRIHNWIDDTNVRWGLSDKDKQQMGLPASPYFTWQYGLDRLMLGFAAQMEEELFQGIYSYDQLGGSDDAALLGKFSRFLNTLAEARKSTRNTHSVEKWSELLAGWITAFIPESQSYSGGFQALHSLAQGMEEAAELGSFDRKIGYSVLLDYLQTKLAGEAARGGYFGHGITFSGLEQMRNIPVRVIGMIGMNNEAFPRTRVSPEFDLMKQDPQPGDRSRRNDDRYLFLEVMQSAREYLYLSYTGQSNRDDSTRPSSVMVSELIDFLREEQGVDPEQVVVRHPLHSYSSRYFSEEQDELFSYSATKFEVSKQVKEGEPRQVEFLEEGHRLPGADESFRQLSVDDLVRFYGHPARYLLQNRLGINFREQEVLSDDREPFDMSGLLSYKLGNELLHRTLEHKPISEFEPIARAKGMLPEGWPGHQAFWDKADEVDEFSSALRQMLELPKLDRQEVSLEIGDFHLTGLLDNLHTEYQLFFRYGSMRPKDLIKLWIYHLVLLSTDHVDYHPKSLLVTKDDNRPAYAMFSTVENPKDYLRDLLDLYWEGLHQKLPLFSSSSFTFAHQVLVEENDEQKALYETDKEWTRSWNPEYGERSDPYNRLLNKYGEPIDSQRFKDLSLKVWSPVFEALNKQEGSIE